MVGSRNRELKAYLVRMREKTNQGVADDKDVQKGLACISKTIFLKCVKLKVITFYLGFPCIASSSMPRGPPRG